MVLNLENFAQHSMQKVGQRKKMHTVHQQQAWKQDQQHVHWVQYAFVLCEWTWLLCVVSLLIILYYMHAAEYLILYEFNYKVPDDVSGLVWSVQSIWWTLIWCNLFSCHSIWTCISGTRFLRAANVVLGFAHTKCKQNTCMLKTLTSVKLPEPESNPSLHDLSQNRARVYL